MEIRNVFLFYTSNKIGFFIMVGFVIGISLGTGLRQIKHLNNRHKMYIGFAGELLVQMMEAVGVPFLVVSLAMAFGTVRPSVPKRVRCALYLYAILTKFFAAAVAMALTIGLKPGKGHMRNKTIEPLHPMPKELYIKEEDRVLDIIRNIFPENWILTSMRRVETTIDYNKTSKIYTFGIQETEPLNLLGLISIAVIVGLSMRLIKIDPKPFMDFLICMFDITLIILRWVLMITPLLLISLTAGETVRIGPIFILTVLALYIVVWILCVIIQILIFYPLIYVSFVHRNPFLMYKLLRGEILSALRTSSTRETSGSFKTCLKETCNFNARLVDYAQPIAGLMNKDGSCIQFAIAYMLMSDYCGVKLRVHSYIMISIFTLFGSVAAGGVPQGSVILLTAFIKGAGLPVCGICVIFALDWAINRVLTIINLLGTFCAIAILDKVFNIPEEDTAKYEDIEQVEPAQGEQEVPPT